MEIFKLKKEHHNYPAGSLGIYDTIIPDGRIRLIMERKMGVPHCIQISQDEVEPYDARVDSITGEIIEYGYCVNDGVKYFKQYADAWNYIQDQGYRSMKDAYEDGYYYWTEWGEGFTFPDDLEQIAVQFKTIEP